MEKRNKRLNSSPVVRDASCEDPGRNTQYAIRNTNRFIGRSWKYIIFTAILIFLLYNSFYFENLGEKRAAKANEEFDAGQYAKSFWNELNKTMEQAADAKQFLTLFRMEPKKAIEKYSTKTRHVSSTHFFLLQGEGKVVSIGQGGVLICLAETEANLVTAERRAVANPEILVATDLIFGNAVRDASGLVDSDDFPDSMDYNKVSEEINKIVMRDVTPSFLDKVKKGLTVHFVGAAEIFESDPQISPLRVIPIKLVPSTISGQALSEVEGLELK